MHLFRARVLIGFAALLAAGTAIAAELPISDFVTPPPLTRPAISPDGKHLAVAVSSNAGSDHPDYQIAVFQLPAMKPVSKLQMAAPFVPGAIVWVTDTRLVVTLQHGVGPLGRPSPIGDIVAVNIDGSNRRMLYSFTNAYATEGYVFTGGDHANSGLDKLHLPPNNATVEALPFEPGHIAINVKIASDKGVDQWTADQTLLYDVDTDYGRAKKISEINHGGMTLIPYHGVARIAVGTDDHLHREAFFSSDGKTWTAMPDSEVGMAFQPLKISRDGKWLYALSNMDGGPDQLIECHLDGSGRKVLASAAFSSVTSVMWDPVTAAPMAAVFAGGGMPHIQFIEEGAAAQILAGLAMGDPGELVTLAGASRDGSKLLIHTVSDRNPGAYVLFDATGMQGHALYKVLPWIDPAAMPRRLPIRFANRSGTELEGFLTLPLSATRNLPMVLIPHGGPIGVRNSWFFDPWAALLANRGYAVLQVNFRGSGGRGQDFRAAGYKQFGSGMQDDLIDGVKWAIAKGYADPHRICVFGGSFGGYAALMQPILAPGLYQCAIDYDGIYDWRIDFKKSDTGSFLLGRRYFKTAIGSAAAAYAISPASRIAQFNVPVLIAHSEGDPRVPFANAVALRAALAAAGKPYEWFVRPGHLHGFHDVKNSAALFASIQAFLAKYIGPGAGAASAQAAR